MKFLFLNEDLLPALRELAGEFDFEIVDKKFDDAFQVDFRLVDEGEIRVEKLDGIYTIFADSKPHLFWGLSQMIFRKQRGEELCFSLNPYFEKNGLMIDNSRNGVVSVEMVKKFLRNMAFLGQNWYMLYMEDVYEIEDEPYFGHMRGRYSKADLKELDDYADMFGIELLPCIQTLAHLNQFFMWEHEALKYKDIDDILNVASDDTIELIDKMLKNLSECFRTETIHIGMDEARDLGRGNYLDDKGYKDKKDIMLEHLTTLKSMCAKYGLKPIIWDDMFFSSYSNVEGDEGFAIPDGIELMYWDYYHLKKEEYLERIEQRQKIATNTSFAGGAWRWMGYVPHHRKTLITTISALSACREKGVKRIVATSWGDDGSEAPFYTTIFGDVLFSFLDVYEEYDEKLFDEWLKFYTDMSFEEWLWQGQLDFLDGFTDEDSLDCTTSKYFLYQDVLMSHFTYYCEQITDDYDAQLDKLVENFSKQEGGWKLLNDFYAQYARVLRMKWKLPLEILNAYKEGDKKTLETLIETRILPLREELETLIKLRRDIWYTECNPSGMEILEYRIGGQIFRLKMAAERLSKYIDGDIDFIAELEEERLDPCPSSPIRERTEPQAIRFNRALKIMSVNRMEWW